MGPVGTLAMYYSCCYALLIGFPLFVHSARVQPKVAVTRINDLATLESIRGSLSPTSQERTYVVGDTQSIPVGHPVVEVVLDRWRQQSKPGSRGVRDDHKVALAVEGGGMVSTLQVK
jgi:hypothetical protein